MDDTSLTTFDNEFVAALRGEGTTAEEMYALLMRYCPDHQDLPVEVLNEAAALTAHPKYREAAWRFYRELAAEAGPRDSNTRIRLRISLFEFIPERPVILDDVEMLFTLLDSEDTRWALFAAYERYPRTLRHHLQQFGKGRITPGEYSDWLRAQNLELTPRGVRPIRFYS